MKRHLAYLLVLIVAVLLILPATIKALAGVALLIGLWLYERLRGGWGSLDG